MANTGAVLIGFILTIVVKLFFAPYEFVGLLIIGFITGYLAHSGALGGLWNAALAGSWRKFCRPLWRIDRIYHFRNYKPVCCD